MARLTVEEVRAMHGYEYQYRVTERVGHEKASFYYSECEYNDYMAEVAKATAAGVLVEYGARFIKAR